MIQRMTPKGSIKQLKIDYALRLKKAGLFPLFYGKTTKFSTGYSHHDYSSDIPLAIKKLQSGIDSIYGIGNFPIWETRSI